MNTARPSLTRSIPFWVLVILSIAAVAFGAWFTLSQISAMNAALTAGTATGVEVYGGQSLAVLGAIVLGAGVVGILLALTVASLRSLVPSEPIGMVEPDDHAGPWDAAPTDDLVADTTRANTAVVTPAASPLVSGDDTPAGTTPPTR